MFDFKTFAAIVADNFDTMQKKYRQLLEVDTNGDPNHLWDLYLKSFPEGTNPIFRTRTHHDGAYDRNVIRQIGHVVGMDPLSLEIETVWSRFETMPYPYNLVAQVLDGYVKQCAIVDVFVTDQHKLGHVQTTELLADGTLHTWNHLHAIVQQHNRSSSPGERRGVAKTRRNQILRLVREVSVGTFDTILELIDGDTPLYRGQEFKESVEKARDLVKTYTGKSPVEQERCSWRDLLTNSSFGFLNSAIGTLAKDLESGMDIDEAVRSFESKVAPSNYRRPSAVVTKGMAEKALKDIKALGIEKSIERRHAVLEDVSINNVLWANREAQTRLKGGLAETLLGAVSLGSSPDLNPQKISKEEFLAILRKDAHRVEALLTAAHIPNLMTLTAPIHPEAPAIFRWGNNMAWTYNGSLADSDISRRVKSAGGSLDGRLRVSLSWEKDDDLDLHLRHPKLGQVYYGRRAGILDVDMNAFEISAHPVENMVMQELPEGKYSFFVHNYNQRAGQARKPGFVIEVALDGVVQQMTYGQNLRSREQVHVLDVYVSKGEAKLVPAEGLGFSGGSLMKMDVWGMTTGQMVDVSAIVKSPNAWGDEPVGNEHLFFILRGAKNPDPVRGIYNEFLTSELHGHRKVFEMLGDRTKAPYSDDQMSGLGFSTTKKSELIVRVTGEKSSRCYAVQL